MKKIFLSVSFVALATITWYAISGFTMPSSTEDVLKKRIAELEKQIASYGNKAPACDYQYFDNEADLRKFIASNYSDKFNYSTIAVNSTSLAKCLSTFPVNSNVYISIIYDVKAGKGMKISNGERICNPFSICCPPNCTPPPRPTKSFALPQSFNPYATF
jgi:hypothetical protein